MPKQSVELGDEIGETPGVVIEHGDVAAGHVGDVHLVALLDQADERAAHADHVVVRVRAENEGTFAGLPAPAGCVQSVAIRSSKTRRPRMLAGPYSRSSSYSSCSRKSSSVSLSRALFDLEAEPDDRLADEGGRPVDRADGPGRANGGQFAGRRLDRAGTWRRDAPAGSWRRPRR